MPRTLQELANLVQGEVLGDGSTLIQSAKPITEAGPGDLTFVEGDRFAHVWHESTASAAVVPPSMPLNGKPLIRVENPLHAFAVIVRSLRNSADTMKVGSVDPSAHIHPSAIIADDATIGPFVVIGANAIIGPRCRLHAGVVVGNDCHLTADVTLHPHVVLYELTLIGERVNIHAHSVIGAAGFGYRTVNGQHELVPQLGGVEIGDDVDIGAATTIDRGTFGPTRIGNGTKIDNQVMIAHNCQIGEANLFVAQVGIAGSTKTGSHVVMAGQVGVADHLTIGDNVMLGARTGLTRNVPDNARMLGQPARPDREMLRIYSILHRLPELQKEIRKIKAKLDSEDGE